MNKLLDRITINPEICHGISCIRGMRWPVEIIIDMLGAGMTNDQILEDHPELEKEDILACLNYARLNLSGKPNIFENTGSVLGSNSSTFYFLNDHEEEVYSLNDGELVNHNNK